MHIGVKNIFIDNFCTKKNYKPTLVIVIYHKSGGSITATVITGSLRTDSRVLDVVSDVREVSGGGIGSDIILYVVTISRLGITLDVTSVRSAESAEADETAKLDNVGNCCTGPTYNYSILKDSVHDMHT